MKIKDSEQQAAAKLGALRAVEERENEKEEVKDSKRSSPA